MTDLTNRIRAMKAKHKQELAPLRKQLAAERKRERESRPKVVKAVKRRTAEERAYDSYLDNKLFCYGCNRETAYLDRAHFVKSGGVGYRVLDLRVVIPLCRLCHTHQESRNGLKGYPYPKLTHANMAWLKRFHEPGNWDAAFVNASNNNKAIEPEQPNLT